MEASAWNYPDSNIHGVNNVKTANVHAGLPDSKVHGPHVGPMNLAIWAYLEPKGPRWTQVGPTMNQWILLYLRELSLLKF